MGPYGIVECVGMRLTVSGADRTISVAQCVPCVQLEEVLGGSLARFVSYGVRSVRRLVLFRGTLEDF